MQTLQQIGDQRMLQSPKQIQLQVSINIGANKFILLVQKNSNLSNSVHSFLHLHQLSHQYYSPILTLIQQQLQKKQIHFQSLQQLQVARQQIQQRKKQAKENIPHSSNKGKNCQKQQMKNKKVDSIQSVQEEQEKEEGKNIYEKWKMKEREKSAKLTPRTPKPNQQKVEEEKIIVKKRQQKRESLHEDYLYQKGLKFVEAKQEHRKILFDRQYPFRLDNKSVSSRKKKQLHDRLYKESKVKTRERIKTDLQAKHERQKVNKKDDKYKLKVKNRDKEIDKALSQLLEKGKVKNSHNIEVVEKSPFRKTILY